MTVKDLIEILDQLPEDMEIFVAVLSNGTINVQPVVESCDDHTIVGYMITDQSPVEVH